MDRRRELMLEHVCLEGLRLDDIDWERGSREVRCDDLFGSVKREIAEACGRMALAAMVRFRRHASAFG